MAVEIPQFIDDVTTVPIQTSTLYWGCSIARFDYQSVEFYTLRLECSHFANGKTMKNFGGASFTEVSLQPVLSCFADVFLFSEQGNYAQHSSAM